MHITGLTIRSGSHPTFSADIEMKLDERVNLFIGPNACGKTSLLRVMAEVGMLDNNALLHFFSPVVTISEDWQSRVDSPTIAEAMLLENTFAMQPYMIFVPWVYIPATRITLPGEYDFNQGALVPDSFNLDRRELFDGSSIDWPDNSYVFDNRWVEGFVKKFFDQFKEGSSEFGELLNVLRRAYRCAGNISKDVIVGNPTNYVLNSLEERALALDEEIDPIAIGPDVQPGMGVSTRRSQGVKAIRQYAGNLSAGTQGIYLWVLYIALKIADHYKFQKAWQNQPAILLIDEIENHLHPTWQRRVIPALLEHFPGLQIFATTHSPFVVAGLKAGQVHLLSRDEDGVVTASTNEQDVIGWTADEILRTMMGVEEPTDQLTVDRAKRLRELRGKGTLTPEEESKIETLRRQVNEDLLSRGGPLEAQRERYADLMQQFIVSRQSELTQDGE